MKIKDKTPLESIYPNIIKNCYILHSENGRHYFSQCSPDKKIKKIYREPIWPWIETIPNETNSLSDKLRFPRPSKRDPYPKLNLRVEGPMTHNLTNVNFPIKTFYMHIIIAKAFCANILNLPVVDHINGNSSDYRIENLRWVTVSENNSGKRAPIGPDKMYDVSSHRGSV
tara:strand:+ start:320 stop:829 length:510 start_codon:yes stop_codon:yes gene_type:complete